MRVIPCISQTSSSCLLEAPLCYGKASNNATFALPIATSSTEHKLDKNNLDVSDSSPDFVKHIANSPKCKSTRLLLDQYTERLVVQS